MYFWAVGQRRAALLGLCQVCAVPSPLWARLESLPAPSAHIDSFLSPSHPVGSSIPTQRQTLVLGL